MENLEQERVGAVQAGEEADVHPMELLLREEGSLFRTPQGGEIVDGVIVGITPQELLVDIGTKTEGVISGRELDRLQEEDVELNVGDPLTVFVVGPEGPDGNIILSLTKAEQERDWRRAEEMLQQQTVFEGTVSGFNRGGVIVKYGRLRGFVPASQLDNAQRTIPPPDDNPDNRWASLVGLTLQFKVMELDRRRNRLILSERQAVREWRKEQKDRLMENLQKGDVRKGKVSSLANFGAFVDLGGADGLIHLSELSWSRVGHPGEVLQIGDEVNVYVLNVDRERKRISLSLRRLQPEPWTELEDKYSIGQLVEGTITKLANFGAFARLEDNIEGLIHISELAHEAISHPHEVVSEGEKCMVRIIRIDKERRRIGLSLKKAQEITKAEVDWQDADELEEWDETEEEWSDYSEEAVGETVTEPVARSA